MDSKVADWVITPRAGRAVEVNALWYNAIRIAADLCDRAGRSSAAREMNQLATAVQQAFNARFWNVQTGCCYDVIDDHGADPSIRPNQLLALSLPFAVLSLDRHTAVLERIRRDLLTPLGLRTLAPSDVGYHGRYCGDVVARERALHNGAVHPWLLGQYVTAHVRVFGKSAKVRDDARALLASCCAAMSRTSSSWRRKWLRRLTRNSPTCRSPSSPRRLLSLSRYSGRGQGEGSAQLMFIRRSILDRANPHPNPFPDYRARSKRR